MTDAPRGSVCTTLGPTIQSHLFVRETMPFCYFQPPSLFSNLPQLFLSIIKLPRHHLLCSPFLPITLAPNRPSPLNALSVNQRWGAGGVRRSDEGPLLAEWEHSHNRGSIGRRPRSSARCRGQHDGEVESERVRGTDTWQTRGTHDTLTRQVVERTGVG